MRDRDLNPEDVLDEFTNKFLQDKDIDIDSYCKDSPSLKPLIQKRSLALKFIEEALKEESWAGKKIGEYIIIEEIGRGGMGIVFLAIQTSLNRYVALKILPQGLTFDISTVKRFRNEARIIAQFNHPNIVPVFSSGEEEGICYITMAFIPGLSLNNIIEGLKSFSSSELKASLVRDIILSHQDFMGFSLDQKNSGVQAAIRPKRDHQFWQKSYTEFILTVSQEVAEALKYAHSNGIYHGDLKPANIILTPEGIPMIVDFGLAKDMKALTTIQSKDFGGTIAYASPEQIKNNIIDEKTDIWSFGVTLYEAISLNHPFNGKTASEILDKVNHSEPPFLKKWNKKISKEVEAIIFRCLEKIPTKRYSNMTMVEEDLRNFIESKPIKAKPIGIASRFHKRIKRHPLMSFLTFGLVVTIMIAFALFFNKKIVDLVNTGNIFYDQGNYDKALYSCYKALNFIKWVPFSTQRHKEIFCKLGDIWLGKGNYEQAIFYYQKAIEIDPKYSSAIVGLADTYFEERLYDKAKEFYKKGIELSPNDRMNYYSLGKVLFNTGLFDDAIANYRIAVTLAPDDKDTLQEIINALNKKGLKADKEIKDYLKKMRFNNEQIDSVFLILRKSNHHN